MAHKAPVNMTVTIISAIVPAIAECLIRCRYRYGSVVSHYERADGTATWERKEEPNAWFFVAHDLTHFAVETILGYRRGFYGLVAEGWALSDFGTPWPRGHCAQWKKVWIGAISTTEEIL
jgi:hypothetical protein